MNDLQVMKYLSVNYRKSLLMLFYNNPVIENDRDEIVRILAFDYGQENANQEIVGQDMNFLIKNGLIEFNEKDNKIFLTDKGKRIYKKLLKKETVPKDSANKERNETIADEVIRLALDNAEFFHDQNKEPFVLFKLKGHKELHPVNSSVFRQWLSKLYYDQTSKALTAEVINNASNLLKGKALFEGKNFSLYNRVARYDGHLWYDLTTDDWKVIRVNESSWEIVGDAPILFRRYNHQSPQSIPDHSATIDDIDLLRKYVNMSDDDFLLFKVTLISYLIPDFPHVIIILSGPQGSAKTTVFKIMKMLIDPSVLLTLSFPTKDTELVQNLSHHWFALFDNISSLKKRVSDLLCRAITGEGFSKRKLYTDEDDVIFNFMRCIGLNGINIPAQYPDLLDRCLIITLNRIPKEKRRKEEDLLKEFEKDRPKILGSIFNIISKAIGIRKNIGLKEFPRMADFAEWGEAISQSMGYPKYRFLQLYYDNIGTQNIEALEAHILGPVILKLMEENDIIEETPTELLQKLEKIAEDMKVKTNSKKWPKAPHILTRRLNEIKTNLLDFGIEYEKDRSGSERKIILKKKNSVIASHDEENRNEKNGSDDTSEKNEPS